MPGVLGMTRPKKRQATHIFRAFWPVVGEPVHTTADLDELLATAAHDLRSVALRHRAAITGPGRGYFARGRDFPGAHGAAQVIVIEAPAEPITRAYHH